MCERERENYVGVFIYMNIYMFCSLPFITKIPNHSPIWSVPQQATALSVQDQEQHQAWLGSGKCQCASVAGCTTRLTSGLATTAIPEKALGLLGVTRTLHGNLCLGTPGKVCCAAPQISAVPSFGFVWELSSLDARCFRSP